jgi:hypothetical protein
MEKILGKWIQKPGQPYEGLWFEFKNDSTFEAQYEPMGIVSSGSFVVEGNQITMQQTAHTLGFTGEFKGLYKIEHEELIMALASGADQDPPEDLSDARIYQKVQE